MDIQISLMNLEEAVSHVADISNAMKAMVMGLDETDSQYSAGFYAIWLYLDEANRQVRERLNDCLNAV